jgi:hypothetical protein
MLELLIVAGVVVACRQVASPCVGAWLLMLMSTESDVDHTPIKSGGNGQFPTADDCSENCTSSPGATIV